MYWSWLLGGLALALVAALHFVLTKRVLAVSGRVSALVDRARFGAPEIVAPESEAALLRAMQEATLKAAAGDPALLAMVEQSVRTAQTAPAGRPKLAPPAGALNHAGFLFGLVGGGMTAAWLSGTLAVEFGLRSQLIARALSEAQVGVFVCLFLGGLLVGFGTRMAGGCTSGHGLCGVSRARPVSIVATASFFGAGVLVSLLMGVFS